MVRIKKTGTNSLLWISVFPILAAGLIFLGVLYYNYEAVRLQDEKYGEIAAIAGLKFDSLLEWRRHRLADIRRASLGPLTRKEISNFFNDPANKTSVAVLKSQLNINKKNIVYADALFTDRTGAIILSDSTDPPPVDKATRNAIEIAAKERKEVMSDLFRSPKDVIYIDAVAPVYDFNGRIKAFMILRSDADDYLFPLIQRWPTPSETAETLLVRREGDFVLFLNKLRHMQNTALTLRMPITSENLPAAKAIYGKYGRFYGKDYRGVDVLAMMLPVPDTSWFMVAKVDSDEILSEVKYRAWVIILFVFLLIIILGGSVNIFYRKHNAAERKKADEELRESEEKYRTLFQTAAEGILVAEIETKRFIYANPAICRMLGYSNEEMISMGVKDIHPEGYLPHVTSQFLALAKGEITQAPEIPCVRKNGSIIYFDIAASAAIIDGRMCNVGFFTDTTERRRSSKIMQELHDLSISIISSSSLEEALKVYLDTTIRLSGMDSGGAYLVNRDKGDLDLIISTGLSADFINEVSHVPADSPAAHIVYQKFPVYVNYHSLGVPLTPARKAEGLRAISVIPIVYNDNVIACLNIASHTIDKISSETQTVLEMIQSSIGNAIGRIVSETALRESEERYRRIINAVMDYIYTVVVKDGTAVETKHGPGCFPVTGYNEDEFTKDPFLWIRMVAADDRLMVEERAKRILAGEDIFPIEHRIIHKNGSVRWVRNTCVPHYDEHGILISYDGLIQNITERKLAEEALRESEEQYRIAIESANDGVTIVQNDTHVYVNRKFLEIFGYNNLEEVLGKPKSFIVHPEYQEMVANYSRAREKGEYAPKRYEFKGIRNDGAIVDIEVSANKILYKGEKATLVYMRDITERKQVEERLKQERERFSVLTENAPFGMVIIDNKGKFLYVNPKFKELFGYDISDIPDGKTWFRKAYPDAEYRHSVISAWIKDLSGASPGEQRPRIFTVRCKDGTERIINFIPVQLETELHIMTCEDITKRTRAEESLLESRNLLGATQQLAKVGGWEWDIEKQTMTWTEETYQIYGYKPGEIKSGSPDHIQRSLACYDPEDRPVIEDAFRRCVERGEPYNLELRITATDGRRLWIQAAAQAVIKEGRIVKVVGNIMDITERRQAEKALIERDMQFKKLSRHVPGMIYQFMRKPDGKYSAPFSTEAIRDIFGCAPEDVREDFSPVAKVILPEDLKKLVDTIEYSAEHLTIWQCEYRVQIPGQPVKWLFGHSTPERLYDGSIVWYGFNSDITVHKLAEEALRESRARLDAIIRGSPMPQFVIDKNHMVIHWNDALEKYSGIKAEEVIGTNQHWKAFYPKKRPCLADLLVDNEIEKIQKLYKDKYSKSKLIEGGYEAIDFFAGMGKSGSWLYFTAAPIRDENGLIVGAIETLEDITERKKAEEALRESEERFRTFIDHSYDAIFINEPDGRMIDANKTMLRMFGVTHEEALRYTIADYFGPGTSMDEALELIRLTLEGEDQLFQRLARRPKDGSLFDVEVYLTRISIGNRDIILANVRDITDHKRIEDALRISEEIFNQFMEHSPVYVFFKDNKIRSLRLSKNFEKMLGRPVSELLGKSMDDLFPSDFAKKMIEDDKRVLSEGKEVVLEEEFDGRYYTTIKFPIKIQNRPPLLAGYTIDITDRKLTQDRLLKEKEKFYTYIENAPFGMMLIKQDGIIFYINQKFKEILGYQLEDIPDGRTWFRKAFPDREYRHEVISVWQTDQERRKIGQQIPRVYTAVAKDSAKKIINFITVLISSGEYLMACEDITERLRAEEEKRKLEERLARAEKMEALGTLSGGVAHDLNNVLGVLIGYAELLIDEKIEANRKDYISNILDGGRKAAAMVEDMLTMTRRGVASREVINLNALIADFENSLAIRSMLNNHASVKIKVDLDPDLLNISGSRVHLEKMLFNLILNAFEAMPKGGMIIISTNNQYLENPIKGYDEVKQGEYVVLSISDTGIGINPKDIERIFEPFYTKKKMGRSGTGLGLAVVWGTVKDHNGYINVKSEEEKGTVFTLFFPVTREEITIERAEIAVTEYMGKGESVLVVDDVKGQRDLAVEMLRKLNYNVSSVSSGEEALEYLKNNAADLIILDMIMDPGMDGLDTYKKVVEIYPKQKAIIVSGFSETNRVEQAQAAGAGAYVKKPYVIEKLGMAVKKELERSTQNDPPA